MKKNIERGIFVVIIVMLLYFVLSGRQTIKELNIAQVLSHQTIDSLTNKNGQLVTTQEVIITNDKKQLKHYTDSIFNLSNKYERRIANIISYYKGVTNTVIDTVFVPYVDPLVKKEWSDSIRKECKTVIDFYEQNSIQVPRTARDSTVNYSVDITASLEGIRINNISIPDTQHVRFVTLKGGILKKNQSGKRPLFQGKSLQVQVLHTNPLIHIIGESSIIYKPPKKKGRVLVPIITLGTGILLGRLIN